MTINDYRLYPLYPVTKVKLGYGTKSGAGSGAGAGVGAGTGAGAGVISMLIISDQLLQFQSPISCKHVSGN